MIRVLALSTHIHVCICYRGPRIDGTRPAKKKFGTRAIFDCDGPPATGNVHSTHKMATWWPKPHFLAPSLCGALISRSLCLSLSLALFPLQATHLFTTSLAYLTLSLSLPLSLSLSLPLSLPLSLSLSLSLSLCLSPSLALFPLGKGEGERERERERERGRERD